MSITRGGILKFFLVLVLLGIGAGVVLWERCGLRGCPDVGELSGYVPDEASVVLDRDGKELGKLYLVQRVVVPLDSLPDYVPKAFVAIEDRRFYEHHGVDWHRVPGAFIANLKAGGVSQGFSTITMQLARNLFPDKLPASERTPWRKLGEMRVAGEIEDRYSKEQILSMYLNQIYFGSGAWGIEAASQEYFGEPASELTLAQAATLAGLPQAPSRDNPRADRDRAHARRNEVLDRMAEQGMITRAEAQKAKDAKLELAKGSDRQDEQAPYFVEAVRQILEQRLGDALYTQGYRIHTTLDADAQAAATRELNQQLDAIEAGRYGTYRWARYHPDAPDSASEGGVDYLQGALVSMDAETGDVLALVGGRDFEQSKFDRATQAERQPGSAFKPFVYATAVARGYPPTFPLDDEPLSMTIDGKEWNPQNYGGEYSGRIPMREALVHSKNVATIRLAEQVGLPNVISTAHAMGIQEDIPPYPSIVLGSVGVSLMEMVSAYTAFATLGQKADPRFVTEVEDRNGAVVWREPVQRRSVIDPGVAFIVTDMLQDVVNRGTGTAVRATGFTGPAAGKTGTTNDGTNAWFIGFTPRVVTGVWIGMDEPRTIVPAATGGRLAAPVWGRMMREAGFAGGQGWSPPAGVEQQQVDSAGNVLAEGCTVQGPTRQEWFLSGTARSRGGCWGAYGDVYGYGDTLMYTDTADEGWFQRLRQRLFGRDEAARADSLARDSLRRRDRVGPPADTFGFRVDTPRVDTLPRDTGRIRVPPRPPTERDTLPFPADTTGPAPRRTMPPPMTPRPTMPRPDTVPTTPRPDTMRTTPRPDTMRTTPRPTAPRPDTTSRPDTTARPPLAGDGGTAETNRAGDTG